MLPVLLVDHGVPVTGVGYIKARYPFMGAAGMIATGHLADRIGRKPPVVAGILIQAADLAVITVGVSHAAHPAWRASALGVYRLWRDAGCAIGALLGGVTVTLASLDTAIGVAAVLTAASGLLAWVFMTETHPGPRAGPGWSDQTGLQAGG